MKKNEIYLFCVFILTLISNAQSVTTLAGSSQGFADGTGAAAQFSSPTKVATDAAGNVYVADQYNHKIRKITPAGVVSTLAGAAQGFADGTGTVAQFNYPFGVATDAAGNVYVADLSNNKIRKITQLLGVAQNEIISKITIYPNPVTTVLSVRLEEGCVVDKIIITDLSGKIIQNQNATTVNVENLAKGLYILEAFSNESKMVSKFIKE